jgi:hypothetical protein
MSPSDYYAALLRTHEAVLAPTQGKLLNYVQRVPLGVVAQITVGIGGALGFVNAENNFKAIQSPTSHRSEKDRTRASCRKQCCRQTIRGITVLFFERSTQLMSASWRLSQC